jgi:hypothetical protein
MKLIKWAYKKLKFLFHFDVREKKKSGCENTIANGQVQNEIQDVQVIQNDGGENGMYVRLVTNQSLDSYGFRKLWNVASVNK